jgi:hypothetical protein
MSLVGQADAFTGIEYHFGAIINSEQKTFEGGLFVVFDCNLTDCLFNWTG